MFLLLHRLMKATVVALLLAGAWWLWSRREAARPLVDYYQVWEAAGYREPEPLPRLKGTVTRAVSDTSLYLRDDRGRVWAVGLTGFFGVDAATREPVLRRLAAESRTNLHALAGQPVELAFTLTNANRTALGYLYVGTNQFGIAEQFVAAGRWKAATDGAKPLPLKEQVRLRAVERLARSNRRGLWHTEPAESEP
jgi:endonuclease YncB( thermonuclease family)